MAWSTHWAVATSTTASVSFNRHKCPGHARSRAQCIGPPAHIITLCLQRSGPDSSPGEIQRKLAQLELSVDGAQGWQRGGQSKTARQKQQEEIRRLQAQLDGYKVHSRT